MANIASLFDTFSGSSVDTSYWQNSTITGGASIGVSGGLITFNVPPSTTAQIQRSGTSYDLNNSNLIVQMGGNAFQNNSTWFLTLEATDFSTYSQLVVNATGGVVYIYTANDLGESSHVAWTPASQQFVRMRWAGTTLYLDGSPDSRVWTNINSTTCLTQSPAWFITMGMVSSAASGTASCSVNSINLLSMALGSATHAQTVDNVTMVYNSTLAVNNATHGHTASNVTLTQQHNLTVQNTNHALTYYITWWAFDTFHTMTSDNVLLRLELNPYSTAEGRVPLYSLDTGEYEISDIAESGTLPVE